MECRTQYATLCPLRMTYWARERDRSVHEYLGVCISDYATTYYLCDVVIDPAFQRRGLGTALVSHIESRPEYRGLRGIQSLRCTANSVMKF